MLIKSYRFYGGKFRLAPTLNFLLPEHTAYYEPFMGSAALLLNHPRSRIEVINDLDPDLSFFMKMLGDRKKGKVLVQKLCNLQYGKCFFNEALTAKKNNFSGMGEIDKAVMIYTLISQSFNGTRKSFANKLYRDNFQYRADIQFNIPQVHNRLQNVQVLNTDGIDLLARIADNPDAFAFADPPYRRELRGAGADRAYACELPDCEQVRLLTTIRDASCKIMLCGYKSENGADLYDTYLKPYGWLCYKLADIVKSCQVTKKHRDVGHEFIWVNYELPYEARYVISMTEY